MHMLQNLLSETRLLAQLLHSLNTSKPQTSIDALHALAVFGSDTSLVATEIHVQFFEGFVLCFGHEKVDESAAHAGKGGEENVGAEFHAREHVAGGEADDEVELCKKERES